MIHRTGIYKIVNKINGKIYYGSAKNFNKRWYRHKQELNKNKHGNKHLQSAWNKYGEINLEFEIILECKESELLMYEQMCLDLYFDNGIKCYNICPTAGSSLGIKRSEETKEKVRQANLGKKHSEETKKKKSLAIIGRKGKKHSEETKKKMSLAKLGNKNNLGKTWKFVDGKRVWMDKNEQ